MDLSPLLRARANYTKHTRRHRYAVAACAQCTQIWAELKRWEELARAAYIKNPAFHVRNVGGGMVQAAADAPPLAPVSSISKSRLQSVVPSPVAPAAIK